jgi:hypothetical protein
LPAVSSLNALRALAKKSHASEPYVGFGNPLLDGEPDKFKEDGPAAKLAREKRCDPTLRQRVASFVGFRGGTHAISNGGIDVADLRPWAPLPETADELCDVAHNLSVDPTTHLYLGAMATEAKVKQLSADGTLAKYKIVHFATHGAVAGQLSRASESGLLVVRKVPKLYQVSPAHSSMRGAFAARLALGSQFEFNSQTHHQGGCRTES